MQLKNLEIKIKNYLISHSNKLKINSLEIQNEDVFFALQGSNTHGNTFIDNAQDNGAKYIVTDKKLKNNKYNNCLEVKNIYDFLLHLATKKRSQFNGKIIAITGSVGKTGIKEFLKYFLSFHITISSSIKSYNNYLGVLISLINMNSDSAFSIFEVGTSNFHEIKKLASLILPHQIIITNIYPTHLEKFHNTRNIAIEKSDLFNPKYNQNLELAILPSSNQDEVYLRKLAKKYCIQSVITFGISANTDYYIRNIKVINNFLSEVEVMTPDGLIQFKVSSSFEHHIVNILISLIIIKYNNLKINIFLNKTNNIPFLEGRGFFYKIKINSNNVTLIDESYNASPASMKNCFNYFEKFIINKNQRKILIIGEMLELGDSSMLYHKEIVSIALSLCINKIIFCGNFYKKILSKIKFNYNKIYCFTDDFEILNFLDKNTHKNDMILAKGSNSSKVNRFVKKLLKKQENK